MSAVSANPSRLTRRQWTALLTAAPLAAAPLVAQVTNTVPPVGSPAPPKPSATPQERLSKAFADVHEVSERLSKIDLPMNLEPAFSFRA